MSKDPAFLFYSSDFLTGTQFFTHEQKGQYITLLCMQHQQGRLQEKHMLLICGAHDNDVIKKFIKDENGLYFNERLEIETLKRKSYSESRRNNRLAHKDMSNISVTYDAHMENENENIIVDKDKVIKDKCEIFKNNLKPFVDEFGKELCNQFYRYWTEPNKTKTKLRWEAQKFFDIKRRLITFRNNAK